MDTGKYKIKPSAVIFLPQIDFINNYQTIACNWETEDIIKINQTGYKILKTIDDLGIADLEKIQLKTGFKRADIEKLLHNMINENIIYEI